MSNPVFPTLSDGSDSSLFQVTLEDVALRTKMEGGYVMSRPRHTRQPRRTFNVGYSYITNADRVLLTSFFDQVKGGSVIFDWTSPEDGGTYQVRFVTDSSGLPFKYVGIKNTKLWNVSFQLEQA